MLCCLSTLDRCTIFMPKESFLEESPEATYKKTGLQCVNWRFEVVKHSGQVESSLSMLSFVNSLSFSLCANPQVLLKSAVILF